MSGDPTTTAIPSGEVPRTVQRAFHRKAVSGAAGRERADDSYVSRMVNLTTLASNIVAAILDETLPPEVTLFELAAATSLFWEEERSMDGLVTRLDRSKGTAKSSPNQSYM
jgi:hypothetical protein